MDLRSKNMHGGSIPTYTNYNSISVKISQLFHVDFHIYLLSFDDFGENSTIYHN